MKNSAQNFKKSSLQQKNNSLQILKNQKGFTLIEILVVIVLIAILAGGVFVALNPVERFQDARNNRRYTDVNSYLTAIHQYIVDNDGSLPTGLSAPTSETQIGTCGSGGATLCSGAAAACVDLSTPLGDYFDSLPVDPSTGSSATTGYSVTVSSNSTITIEACSAESGETITVSR